MNYLQAQVTKKKKGPPSDEVFMGFSASLGHSEPLQVTSEMLRIWEGLEELEDL